VFVVRDFDIAVISPSIFPPSFDYNLISETNVNSVRTLSNQQALSNEHNRLLLSILAPFKLLVIRSAQQVSRLARASSMSLLPKDMCRMVGDMLGPFIEESDSEDSDDEEEE
jgi:hypothetical protein